MIIDDEEIATPRNEELVTILPARDGSLVVQYEGTFSDVGEEPSGVISDKGIFLAGTWYPKPDEMCLYRLTVALQKGYEAISEAEVIEKSAANESILFTFHFSHPLDGINLMASHRYRVERETHGDVEIFAYFFTEDADLIRTYLEHAKRFLKLYETMIDRYPYRRFSIVENFLPTGYSMPTYTVLGQTVVRLPFIPETSLGHEILHQWFGNCVYIDYEKGNWAEGLTSFLADHFYEQEKGKGSVYRKGVLIDYQSYVNKGNEFPLREFTARTDYASRAIGYGKALMVFQMLKELVGEERFRQSLTHFVTEMRFKRASWDDLRRAFEKLYQKDLIPYFRQWIDERGLPELYLEGAEARLSGSNFSVAFSVRQKGKAYTLDLPANVYFHGGKTKHRLHLSKEKEKFEITVAGLPERIVLDEGYDVGRKLSIDEFPPVIARLLGDEARIIVLPSSQPERYEEVMAAFKRKGTKVSEPEGVTVDDLKTHSVIILDADNPMVKALYGDVPHEAGFSVVMKDLPWNRWKVAAVIDAGSKSEVKDAFRKIFHYGNYSALSFDHGRNISKSVAESSRGITEELHKEAAAVDLSSLTALPQVMNRVADREIIYVGEIHDTFSHHVMELEIIKDLHRRGKKIAIGMEMFQKPFQKIIDEYVEGKIDEKTFLKRSEYFKRWSFDYNFYRPILLFARSEKIPVIALNQKQAIVEKVSHKGLDSLSPEEKKSIPSQMDFSDDAYRERLKKVFRAHKHFEPDNFDFFYQAQILWDETMAESVDQFLNLHRDHQMVVLAGSGHLAYGSGIPKRVARRNGYGYVIILNDADLEKGIADFILFPGDIPGITSPKLMVFLKDETGKVAITGFTPKSVSQEAGMEVGDVILSVDNVPVQTIDDLKIELLSRKRGEKVNVNVLRKGLLGFNKELEFGVVLK
jgi:aminopeptidase N